MREIKFRGWDDHYKTWIFGDLKLNEAGDKAIITPRMDGYLSPCCVDRNTVGQFTGLLDSNGKEIFEGDIVRVVHYGDESIHVIKYCDDMDYPAFDLWPNFDCECNGLSFCECDNDTTITVIGNIHENQELLESKKDA